MYLAFQIYAYNAAGNGPTSSVYVIQTATIPNTMAAPTLSNFNCQLMTINWVPYTTNATNGRTNPTYYMLYWKTKADATWYALTTANTGFLSSSMALSMATAYTGYSWTTNTAYLFYTTQCNEAGCSAQSPSLTVQTSAIPATMNQPVIPAANINPTNINITWTSMDLSASTNYNCTISSY